MADPTPTAVSNAWVAVGLLKASVVLVVCLVKFKVVPPQFLLVIPLLYIGVGVYAVLNHVYNAAFLCGMILVVLVIVNLIPSPARDAFRRLWHQ